LLLGVCKNDAKYATTGTAAKFWAVWREEYSPEDEVKLKESCNTLLSLSDKTKILSWRKNHQKYEPLMEETNRLVTEQDKILFSLCRPDRLLELTYRFLIYDAG